LSTIADPSLLHRAAAALAGGQRFERGALYVVATPIGNLADITLRALHLLGLADAVACEDTRVAASLLRAYGLARPGLPLLAVHAHNEAEAAGAVLARLAAGERVVLISDAGTPAVSDPGARLVAATVAAGHTVVPLPGASSALAALCVAGDTAEGGFTFAGFLPSKGAERQAALAALLAEPRTQILFEAPHRIATLAASLAADAPERTLTLARELTKQFETLVTMPAAALPAWLASTPHAERGEFVIVLHAAPAAPAAAEGALPPHAAHVLDTLLAELPLKQAAALAARLTGLPRKRLYAEALQRRGPGTESAPDGAGSEHGIDPDADPDAGRADAD
jgi:16S rRNA (cytidine1402-2'-O)-methyltransferase